MVVFVEKNDSVIKRSWVKSNGDFEIKDIPKGVYKITIQQRFHRDYTMDSFKIATNTVLNLSYPFPCMFNYPKHFKPRCIGGHTDHIIPIR